MSHDLEHMNCLFETQDTAMSPRTRDSRNPKPCLVSGSAVGEGNRQKDGHVPSSLAF
jgi:hypothetical protein